MGELSTASFPEHDAGRPVFIEAKWSRRRPGRVVKTGLALLAVATFGAACSSGDDGESSAPTTRGDTTTTTAGGETTSTTAAQGSTPSSEQPTTTGGGGVDACAETQGWNTNPDDHLGAGLPEDELYLPRVGRHECFDRFAINVNDVVPGSDVVGYHVSYVPGEVAADGSGEPVPTIGSAALQIIIQAPPLGSVSGHVEQLPTGLGDSWVGADELGGTVFNEVANAGTFEGQTTIAVGLDEQLPFAVDAYEEDGRTVFYVDIAHPAG